MAIWLKPVSYAYAVDLDEPRQNTLRPTWMRPLPQGAGSGRKARKSNSMNKMFGSRYRHPYNDKTLMVALIPLGKAFAISAGMNSH